MGLPGRTTALRFDSFNLDYIQRLTEGDSGAEDHFASYFGSMLFLKLRVRLRSIPLIEDVRQETLMRVLLILREGEGVKRPERFGAFVNGVCNNVVREFRRLDGREDPWDDNLEEPADPHADLDAGLDIAGLKLDIRRILAELPDKDRQILQSIFLDEIDKAEICRRFQVDPNYLRVLVHRAKGHFRKAYCRADVRSPVNPAEG